MILGTKGHAIVDRAGYEIYDLDANLLSERKVYGRAVDTNDLKGAGALTDAHISNFLDCIRGKAAQQNSPIGPGHVSTMFCHLGNIAYRSGRTLECDPANGHIKNLDAAEFWSREYESGWELKV